MGSLTSTGSITLSTGRLLLSNTDFGLSHKNTTGGISEIVTYSDGNNMNHIGSYTNNDFSLSVNQVQYLTVKNTTGRIGINTASPNMQLEVNSHSGNCLRLFNSGGNTFLDVSINNQGLTTLVLSGSSPSFSLSHSVSIIDNTTSVSTSTGALIVTGGVGIGGALNVGGAISTTGNITGTIVTASQPNITSVGTLTSLSSSGVVNITNSTASTTTSTGAFVVTGGVGLNSNINIARNISYGLSNYNWSGNSGPGVQLTNTASILTNTSVVQNGTISLTTANHINRITLAATNTNITTTVASSLYIENSPLAGTNMNITNSYALVINNGRTLINDSTISNSTTSGALIISGGVGMGGALNVAGTITATGNITGTLATASQPNITSVGTLTSLSTTNLTINGSLVTSTASELNYLDLSVGPGTAGASRAVVLDSSRNIININSLTATNLTGIIQTAGQPNITSTGDLTLPTSLTITNATTPLNISNTSSSSTFILTIQTSGGHQDIGSFTTHDMSLITNNTRRLTITSTGNVNITEHNAINTGLQLNGLLVTSTASELNYLDLTTGPGTAEASKALILDNSRNITNINTISLNGNGDVITMTNLVSSNRTTIRFINNARSWELGSRGSTMSDPNSFYLWDNTANSMRLNINSSGNVGIGLNNQAYRLDVNGSINTTGLLRTTANGEGFFHTQSGITLNSWVSSTQSVAWFGTSSNHDVIFQRNATEILRLTSSGISVGSITSIGAISTSGAINTTNSTASTNPTSGALRVTGGVGIGGALNVGGSITATGNITGTLATASQPNITSVGTLVSLNISTVSFSNSSTYSAKYIGNWPFSGYWGIGPSVASDGSGAVRISNVDISGNYQANTNVICGSLNLTSGINITMSFGYLNSNGTTGTASGTNSYSLFCSQRAAAVEFNSYSDIRVKSNVNDLNIEYCKNFILNMKPKKYKLTNSDKYSYGYIAQELLKNNYEDLVDVIYKEGMKELIDTDNFVSPKDGLFVLNYNNIVPILAKNIENIYNENKNITQKNEYLENEIEQLKNEIEQLKNDNSLLKEQIDLIKNKLKI